MSKTQGNPIASLRQARDEWHAAHPYTAMQILAELGMDMMQRREALRSWGCNEDDVIDYSSDVFIGEVTYPEIVSTEEWEAAKRHGYTSVSADGATSMLKMTDNGTALVRVLAWDVV